jgi:hypothetical protein
MKRSEVSEIRSQFIRTESRDLTSFLRYMMYYRVWDRRLTPDSGLQSDLLAQLMQTPSTSILLKHIQSCHSTRIEARQRRRIRHLKRIKLKFINLILSRRKGENCMCLKNHIHGNFDHIITNMWKTQSSLRCFELIPTDRHPQDLSSSVSCLSSVPALTARPNTCHRMIGKCGGAKSADADEMNFVMRQIPHSGFVRVHSSVDRELGNDGLN